MYAKDLPAVNLHRLVPTISLVVLCASLVANTERGTEKIELSGHDPSEY